MDDRKKKKDLNDPALNDYVFEATYITPQGAYECQNIPIKAVSEHRARRNLVERLLSFEHRIKVILLVPTQKEEA